MMVKLTICPECMDGTVELKKKVQCILTSAPIEILSPSDDVDCTKA